MPRSVAAMSAVLMTLALAPFAGAAGAIERVLAFPKADRVRVVVSAAAGAALSAEIVPAGGGEPIWRGALNQANAGGESQTVISGLKPKLWSPGAPDLYVLKVSASGETESVRFGFRSLESKDGHILLNGHPIFLRGLAINPPERDIPDALGYSPEFVHAYVKYLRSQNVNIIRMTFVMRPDPRQQVWFDACDELGMMVYQGDYGAPPAGAKSARNGGRNVDPEEQNDLFSGRKSAASKEPAYAPDLEVEDGGKQSPPKDFNASMAAYEETFATYARHPSIVIYVLSNELPYTGKRGQAWHAYLTKACDYLRKNWDDSRLFIGNAGYGQGKEGDINDVHRYWGWYYNTVLTYYNLRHTQDLYGDKDKVQPFTFSECVGNFTGPAGEYNLTFHKQLAPQLGWTGHGADQKDLALAHQAYTVQHACESFRTMRAENPRLSGLMPFTIQFFNWAGITRFEQMHPKPSMLQMGLAYQPVLLSWENWRDNVYAGTTLRPIAHVVNDADDFSDLTGAALAWELKARSGQVVARGSKDLPDLPYYGTQATPLDIAIPSAAATGEYVLSGTISRAGKVISRNAKTIFIAGNNWLGPMAWGGPALAVYDPSGKTIAAMKKLDFPVESVNDLSRLPGQRLIIGEGAADGKLSGLKDFIDHGGRVLVLGQDHAKVDASFVPAKLKFFTTSANSPDYLDKLRPTYDQMNINPERPDDPLFSGIDRARLKTWSDYTDWDETRPGFPAIYPVTHGFELTDAADLAHTAILADYDRGLEGVALCEVFSKQKDGGSAILSAFDLVPRIGLDPIADKLLRNLVQYLVSPAHELHPLVTQPIEWGQYETEMGVLPGPLTGLVYNCVWQPPPTDPNAKPMADNGGAWNTHPGNQFVARGIRPFGPYTWSTGASPQQAHRGAKTGQGTFYCRVPAGRTVMLNRVRNQTKAEAKLVISVNGKPSPAILLPPGKTVTIRTPLAGHTDVAVGYAGDVGVVIEETSFE